MCLFDWDNKIWTLDTAFHLLSAGRRQRTKWTQCAPPLILTATCSLKMFSYFLDLFSIFESLQPTCSLLLHPLLLLHLAHCHLSCFPPGGGPSWGSLPSIAGASDCGIGHLRQSPPDQSYQFQHLFPTVPDENVGIPHATQQAWSNL